MTARLQKSVKQYFKGNVGTIGILLILCIFSSVFPEASDSFLTQKSIFNVLRQVSFNLSLAHSMTMVIILGGIDLPVGSITALSGCFAAGCVSRYGFPITVGVLDGVLVGTVVDMINGVIISKITIPPFIVTLAIMNIAKGLAYVHAGDSPVRAVTGRWQSLGAGYVGGVPTPVILLAVMLAITTIIMNETKLECHIHAVGGGSQAARFSGISMAKMKFLVYTYSGVMAGLADVVLASRTYSSQPTAGDGTEMGVITAVVVGSTPMAGGFGKIGGTIIGGLIIGVLNSGLNLLNVNPFWQYVVKGAVILLAVSVNYLGNKKAE